MDLFWYTPCSKCRQGQSCFLLWWWDPPSNLEMGQERWVRSPAGPHAHPQSKERWLKAGSCCHSRAAYLVPRRPALPLPLQSHCPTPSICSGPVSSVYGFHQLGIIWQKIRESAGLFQRPALWISKHLGFWVEKVKGRKGSVIATYLTNSRF